MILPSHPQVRVQLIPITHSSWCCIMTSPNLPLHLALTRTSRYSQGPLTAKGILGGLIGMKVLLFTLAWWLTLLAVPSFSAFVMLLRTWDCWCRSWAEGDPTNGPLVEGMTWDLWLDRWVNGEFEWGEGDGEAEAVEARKLRFRRRRDRDNLILKDYTC